MERSSRLPRAEPPRRPEELEAKTKGLSVCRKRNIAKDCIYPVFVRIVSLKQ
jgi:hypothetical protein